jgi:hypothetical protein
VSRVDWVTGETTYDVSQMETFPAPSLLPNMFAEMPEPGTRITESEALRILRDLVRTIYALIAILHE